jgi:hypothetical protein
MCFNRHKPRKTNGANLTHPLVGTAKRLDEKCTKPRRVARTWAWFSSVKIRGFTRDRSRATLNFYVFDCWSFVLLPVKSKPEGEALAMVFGLTNLSKVCKALHLTAGASLNRNWRVGLPQNLGSVWTQISARRGLLYLLNFISGFLE